MKKAAGILATIMLGVALLTGPAVSAASADYIIDATHMFDQDVEKLVKNVKRETKKEYSRRVKSNPETRVYKVGDVETFWTKNIVENKFEQTRAILKLVGKHCYIFLEEGKSLPQEALVKLQKQFDDNIYPTNTRNFGFEAKPGIDGDERITLLMFDIKDGFNGQGGFVGGYFFAGDQFLNANIPANYNIKSNEREMFYLDIYPSDPTKDRFLATIAHEFQHMIHFNQDSREMTWVNEACSQIAPYLCGFGHASQILSYMKTPDNSLIAWSDAQMLANYGQVYLWNYYIFNRFVRDNAGRNDFFKKLVASKQTGIKGYIEALKPLGKGMTDTFLKFMVANYINDPRLGKEGEYAYDNSLGKMILPVSETVSALPAEVAGEVFFWSGDAIKVDLANAKADVEVKFTAPMFQLGYEDFNEFAVAVVQSNSRGQVAPKIVWMNINQVKSRKTQGGTVKVTPSKDFDTAQIIVIGLAPENVDEAIYKKSKGIKYSLKINDSGVAVDRPARFVDASQLLENYRSFADDTENSSENAIMVRLANLEDLNRSFAANLSAELENNDFAAIDELIEKIENGTLQSDSIKPLLKNAINIAEFQAAAQPENHELRQRIDMLRAL